MQILKSLVLSALVGCGGSSTPKAKQSAPEVHAVRRGEVVSDGHTRPVKAVNPDGPKVYYDAVHEARHLHNRDNRRYRTDYHTISGWFRLTQALRTAGYQVDAENHACFDRATLDAYDVFVVGEQTYHARFMTQQERTDLAEWVHDGGGLFITSEHTNAHNMGDVFNLITEPMPVKARFDSLCDPETSDRSSRDWVKLTPTSKHPVTEGVKAFHFYNGCSLETEHGVLSSSEAGWSDAYRPEKPPVFNGNKRKDKGEISGVLHGVAAFEYGEGRVVVIGDHNGLSNTELYVEDHHRFAMNAMRWLAGADDRPELSNWEYPDGYDVLVHAPEDSHFGLHKKANRNSYRALYSYWGKEAQHRTWARTEIEPGHEMLILGAPVETFTAEELKVVDGYFEAGKPVLWMATNGSLGSEASEQLQKHFGLTIEVDETTKLSTRMPLEVHGPRDWTAGVLRLFAPKGMPAIRVKGADHVIRLQSGEWKIEKVDEDAPILIDLLSKKSMGEGELYLLTPLEIFDDQHLPGMNGERQDVIRQQAGELAIRMLKVPLGDDIHYVD